MEKLDIKEVAKKDKDIRARVWLCTLNNPGALSLSDIHDVTKARYTVGQLEKGESGTLHFQFYQNFATAVRLAHYKKVLPAAHVEPVKVQGAAQKYCMKQDTRVDGPWEFGQKPLERNSKKDWEEIYQKAKEGKIEDIPADVRVRCYSQLKRIEKDNLVFKDLGELRGIWIYGRSGYGKSRSARANYPNAYPKLVNKWWDGYRGQENVIMDDFGLEHKMFAQHLKIWTDRYAAVLETKGGALSNENIKNFVVTSQYSIEEIWSGDEPTIEALSRRFSVIHISQPMFNDNLPLNDQSSVKSTGSEAKRKVEAFFKKRALEKMNNCRTFTCDSFDTGHLKNVSECWDSDKDNLSDA